MRWGVVPDAGKSRAALSTRPDNYDNSLERDDGPRDGLFVEPKLLDEQRITLLGLLDTVVETNWKSAPYAFRYDGSSRVRPADGLVMIGESCLGLTCATFVMTLFESVGFPVLRLTPWVPRPGDSEWRNAILGLLRKFEAIGRIEKGWTDRVEAEENWQRYRPEDVLAAGVFAPPSAHFKRVAPRAASCRKHVLEQ